MPGTAHRRKRTDIDTSNKEYGKLLQANLKLQKEMEAEKNRADKYYNLFLQVSSYCACQKKAVGK
jgi:hypothetical protein